MSFLFSVPSGKPVELKPFHLAIVGQTQLSGKTTLLKRLSSWAADLGFKILIFDTKETEADYAGFGTEIPVCMRAPTNTMVLLGLLESRYKRRLTNYLAPLSYLTQGVNQKDPDAMELIIERAREREASARGWMKGAYQTLYILMEQFNEELKTVDASDELQLVDGINRMVINKFSIETQQIIVQNAFEDALTKYKRKLIIQVDEAFKFLPQKYSSAATPAIMKVITQGAKTELFVWIATQFLAVVNKDVLKACAIKFLGTQDHPTEVKHTLAMIPEVRGKFKPEEIMKMQRGHWILVRRDPSDVRKIYSLPLDVPEYVGMEIATGVREAISAKSFMMHNEEKVRDEETVYKEKYEELKSLYAKTNEKVATLTLSLKESTQLIKNLQKELDKTKRMMRVVEKTQGNSDILRKNQQLVQHQANVDIMSRNPIESDPVQIDIDKIDMTIKVHHIPKSKRFRTTGLKGRIMYAVVSCKKTNIPISKHDILMYMQEQGWHYDIMALSPRISELVKEGYLVPFIGQQGGETLYRLPMKVKVEVDNV